MSVVIVTIVTIVERFERMERPKLFLASLLDIRYEELE